MATFFRTVWREWLLGLERSWNSFRHPWLAIRSIALAFPALMAFRRLLRALSAGSVVIATPARAPVLCSRISAFGSITVQVEQDAVLPDAVVAEHHREVRERLKPFEDLSVLTALVHGLVASVPLAVGAWRALLASLSNVATLSGVLGPLLWGSLCSAIGAALFRTLLRWVTQLGLRRLGL